MGQILFDTGISVNTVNFRLQAKGEMFVPYVNKAVRNRTGNGNVETLIDCFVFKVSFDAYISEPEWENYFAWFAWAAQGKPFSIKFDVTSAWATHTAALQTVLDTLNVDSITGITPGDVLFIRSPSTLQFEQNRVLSVSADPDTVITETPLKLYYPEGSLVRASRYFPSATMSERMKEFASDRSLATDKDAEGYRNVKFEAEERVEIFA